MVETSELNIETALDKWANTIKVVIGDIADLARMEKISLYAEIYTTSIKYNDNVIKYKDTNHLFMAIKILSKLDTLDNITMITAPVYDIVSGRRIFASDYELLINIGSYDEKLHGDRDLYIENMIIYNIVDYLNDFKTKPVYLYDLISCLDIKKYDGSDYVIVRSRLAVLEDIDK